MTNVVNTGTLVILSLHAYGHTCAYVCVPSQRTWVVLGRYQIGFCTGFCQKNLTPTPKPPQDKGLLDVEPPETESLCKPFTR